MHLTESLPPFDGNASDAESQSIGRGQMDAAAAAAADDADDDDDEASVGAAWLRRRLGKGRDDRGLTAALGTPSADWLRSLSPAAGQSPHLVHMVGHIH